MVRDRGFEPLTPTVETTRTFSTTLSSPGTKPFWHNSKRPLLRAPLECWRISERGFRGHDYPLQEMNFQRHFTSRLDTNGYGGDTQSCLGTTRENRGLRSERFYGTVTLPTKLSYAPKSSETIITNRHVAHPGRLIASNVVIQIRGKSLFHCGLRFTTPGCVIHYLVTPDLADPEIFCLGMREIKAAHARTGVHCKRFS